MFRQLIFQNAEPAPIATKSGTEEALKQIRRSKKLYFPSYQILSKILDEFYYSTWENTEYNKKEHPAIFKDMKKYIQLFGENYNHHYSIYPFYYKEIRKKGLKILGRFVKWEKVGKLNSVYNKNLSKKESENINKRLHKIQEEFNKFPSEL
tara:strand:- start:269 stop:721 length:453 start_codon:yes stop_codon:yes gene_type:complete